MSGVTAFVESAPSPKFDCAVRWDVRDADVSYTRVGSVEDLFVRPERL